MRSAVSRTTRLTVSPAIRARTRLTTSSIAASEICGAAACATGRDFSDVSPVDGIIVGSRKQKLRVEVDVMPVE